MKTNSVDAVSQFSSASADKTSKQGSLGQTVSNFSNIIDNISSTNQTVVTNLSSEKTNNTVASKNTVNTAVKSKVENSDSTSEENSQVNERENQRVSSNITTCEEKLNSTNSLEEASTKIKNILLDVLGVSEEDLDSAMQVLGLEYLDCLDKNNLAQLLTQISGNSDISALITDETLYQQLNDAFTLVNGVKEDILADLGITEDELMAALDQVNNKKSSTIVENTVAVVEENKTQDISAKEPSSIVDTAKEIVSNSILSKSEDSTVKQDKAETSVVEEISSGTDKIKTVTTNSPQDNSEEHTDDKQELTTKLSDTAKVDDKTSVNYQEYTLGQEKLENVVNDLKEAPIDQKASVDVESIVKQIQNQIKVSVNVDTTKMEFQLNPEHLGKLTIQIASKDGIVSAQITAQNLAVKEVLESQIVQLRDNMNNQGLKVDAVEVTVESHEFERNLDERNSNANQEQFEQQEKNSRRQLNYYDSDTLEDMSAEEALIAEMMIGNGNSINYTA
jgi:flagellar hook-length control protein FliK